MLPTRGTGDEGETAMRPKLLLALAALLGSAHDGRADPGNVIGSGY
jgi:hypothetical protein